MKRISSLLLGTIIAAAAILTPATPVRAEKVLEGQVCSEKVHALTSEIEWYKSLHKAEDAARNQGKLVFWVHMLGKIDGAT